MPHTDTHAKSNAKTSSGCLFLLFSLSTRILEYQLRQNANSFTPFNKRRSAEPNATVCALPCQRSHPTHTLAQPSLHHHQQQLKQLRRVSRLPPHFFHCGSRLSCFRRRRQRHWMTANFFTRYRPLSSLAAPSARGPRVWNERQRGSRQTGVPTNGGGA